MREELDQALCKDFPHVFASRGLTPTESCFAFGFECGDGWEPLIRKAAAKLEPIIIDLIDKDPEAWAQGMFTTSQIKEKYGTLRWYLSSGTDAMYAITDAAEDESAIICETCGEPGKLRGSGWYYTSCFLHCHENDRDNLEYLEMKYDEKIKGEIK